MCCSAVYIIIHLVERPVIPAPDPSFVPVFVYEREHIINCILVSVCEFSGYFGQPAHHIQKLNKF